MYFCIFFFNEKISIVVAGAMKIIESTEMFIESRPLEEKDDKEGEEEEEGKGNKEGEEEGEEREEEKTTQDEHLYLRISVDIESTIRWHQRNC